ncbi:MAG: cytochrome c, partial [Sandaracinus sp.]|nr:cytochrome c [Sandaracinus sp.]
MASLCALVSLSVSGGCQRNVAPPRTVLAQYEGPVRSRDVITGLNIYQTVCSVCHAGRVNPAGYHWSPGQMRQQIRRGNRLMPPLGHELLSDAQVEAVLAYLVGTDAVEGELPPLTREDVARETRGAAASRVAAERRREELVEELDPSLRPPAEAPPTVEADSSDVPSPDVHEAEAHPAATSSSEPSTAGTEVSEPDVASEANESRTEGQPPEGGGEA